MVGEKVTSKVRVAVLRTSYTGGALKRTFLHGAGVMRERKVPGVRNIQKGPVWAVASGRKRDINPDQKL